jgi:uncharacterized protein (TIGR03790 family)
VVNELSPVSRQIADYYRIRRSVPPANLCSIRTPPNEEIEWSVYESQIERPIGECLKRGKLQEQILYIVTTLGVPLKVNGTGKDLASERCSVDSELALLYAKLKGVKYQRPGGITNPFYMKRDQAFQHPRFPIYLIARLAAYDIADVKGMIDRALAARNRGKFVLDQRSSDDTGGESWLATAAILLPADRTILDTSQKALYDLKDVIGYASWGSNDPHRTRRSPGFQWMPGAIATEFVSTNARTFLLPPARWTPGSWGDPLHTFAGTPQNLTADLIRDGATGASGNVYEPYLQACVRPDYLLPAYFEGRNLAESFYVALPYLSWQGVVLGDPLCRIGKP